MVTTYKLKCRNCEEHQFILAHPRDIERWMDGEKIQKVLAYLTPDEREMLISRICPTCWTKLFGSEE